VLLSLFVVIIPHIFMNCEGLQMSPALSGASASHRHPSRDAVSLLSALQLMTILGVQVVQMGKQMAVTHNISCEDLKKTCLHVLFDAF
jgi:hypothetical protein